MHKEIGVGRAHSKICLNWRACAVVYGYPLLRYHSIIYRSDLARSFRQIVHGFCLKMTPCPWRFLRPLEQFPICEAGIRCRIQSMVPENGGMGSSAPVSIVNLFVPFLTIIKSELDDETFRNPGQSSRNHCSYESAARCQDLFE